MTRARAVCGTLLPATVLGLAIAHSATGDWTEFRGPTGQGLASSVDLPLEWSASEHVRWKTPLPGEGWSSPVVADGRVYLTAAVPIPESGDFSLRLIILDGASGQVIRSVEAFHQAEADAAQIHSKNSHASPTPLVDGDRVYVHFGPAGLACFNLAGEPIWRNDSFRYPPRHGNGGSPALAKGKLIFSCDGDTDPFILALEQETGDVAWKTPRRTDAAKTFSFATPLHIVAAGRDQVICPGSNCVVSLDPDTGDEICASITMATRWFLARFSVTVWCTSAPASTRLWPWRSVRMDRATSRKLTSHGRHGAGLPTRPRCCSSATTCTWSRIVALPRV